LHATDLFSVHTDTLSRIGNCRQAGVIVVRQRDFWRLDQAAAPPSVDVRCAQLVVVHDHVGGVEQRPGLLVDPVAHRLLDAGTSEEPLAAPSHVA
jgi:hypothetical protein